MNILKNNKGSTLATAIIVSLIILSLMTGMYILALIYHQNSEKNHYSRQAYLFAKSECKVFSQYLSNQGKDSPYFPDPQKANSKSTVINANITLSNNNNVNDDMIKGIKKNYVEYRWYSNNQIKYKVTVNYKGETSTVTLSCTKPTNDTTYKKWTFLYE